MHARFLSLTMMAVLVASCAQAQEAKPGAAATMPGAATAPAAATKPEAPPVMVALKDGTMLELKSVQVGTEDAGLFGTSFSSLRKLPVKSDKLHLDVPMDRLAKIEFLPAESQSKDVRLRLTAVDGKQMECVVDSAAPLMWRGIMPFADAEVKLDAAALKEIVLKPVKK